MTFEKFLTTLLEIISALLKTLWNLGLYIYYSISGERPAPALKETFDASFTDPSRILRKENLGFCLTGTRSISLKESHTNVLVAAKSGAGKTSSVILPSIFRMADGPSSLIIHDPSMEIFTKTSGYLESKGYTVKLINFADPSISEGYNPLVRATTRSDIQKLAALLVKNVMGENAKDPFWNNQAVSLITLFCLVCQHQEESYRNLANVKRLIDTFLISPESIDPLIVACRDESILNEYKIFTSYESKVLINIISTCRSVLSLFDDPSVQAVTSVDTLSFSELRNEKQAIFLANRTSDMKYYASLVSSFSEQASAFIMSRIPDMERENHIFLLLDELSSLYLPSLQIALSNVRKYSCGIMCIVQDTNQLRMYGTDYEPIKTNCSTRIYFHDQPMDVCKEISEMLGKREFEMEHKDGTKERRTRNLLTADEVKYLEPGYALIFTGSRRAMYTYMRPYYAQKDMLRYSTLPPVQLTSKVPDSVSFIPLSSHG